MIPLSPALTTFRENRETITLDYQASLRCKNTSFSQILQLFRQENAICEKYSFA